MGDPAGVLRVLPKSLAVSAGEKGGALAARLLTLSGEGAALAARSWPLTAGLALLLPPALPPPNVKGWADTFRLPPRDPNAMLPPPLLVGLSLP